MIISLTGNISCIDQFVLRHEEFFFRHIDTAKVCVDRAVSLVGHVEGVAAVVFAAN